MLTSNNLFLKQNSNHYFEDPHSGPWLIGSFELAQFFCATPQY
jgi:hypothetical protein